MTWEEVDLENAIWTIPPERMKAKVMHRVPLSPRALQIPLRVRKNSTTLWFSRRSETRLSFPTWRSPPYSAA